MNANRTVRPGFSALLVLPLVGFGCSEATSTTGTSVSNTPSSVISPAAPDEPQAGPVRTEAPKTDPASTDPSGSPKADPAKPEAAASGTATTTVVSTTGEVALVPVKYDELRARIAANKKTKLTMVDAWATWCGPCKENFPHVVEMNAKYAEKGLAVISLSLDEPTNARAVEQAKKFLEEKKAVFTNYVLDEEADVAFDKLNISGIPAVFLFGPDGQEIRRFTGDDPNNQFTYDQVEQAVAALLEK